MQEIAEAPSTKAIPERPPECWPASDQAALTARVPSRRDPFAVKRTGNAVGKSLGELRPTTRANLEKAYGKWVAFLEAHAPESLLDPPAARATEERVAAYLETLKRTGLAPASLGFHLYNLLMALRRIAPCEDWTWLQEAATWLRMTATPVRDKSARTLPIRDVYQLGIAEMETALSSHCTVQSARRYRNGFILALWAARPWRIQNFAALDLERHIRSTDSADLVRVQFDAEEMKTRVARTWDLPHHLTCYLTTYQHQIRPRLPGADETSRMWPSQRGSGLTHGQLARILGQLTHEAFDMRLHPHALRYSAATSAARSGVAAAEIIPVILGHSDPRTSVEYYVMAKSLEAQARFVTTIQNLRDNQYKQIL